MIRTPLNQRLNADSTREYLQQKFGSVFFPDPPLPGNQSIVPIRSVDQLIEEGSVMNNCVASYAHEVMTGESFIYRVLHPQRCTLSVEKSASGRMKIEEMKLFNNQVPDKATYAAVKEWIRDMADRSLSMES